MTLTAEQLEARRGFIGASDVPALFGKSPYKTAWDVWASKVHGIESSVGEAAAIGDTMEPVLVDRFEERVGLRTERHLTVMHPTCKVLSVNLDACVRDGDYIARVIECKTHGLASPARRSDEWGESGTDQIPDDVMLQVQAQLEACNCPDASVEALIGGRGFLTYAVKRNKKLGAMIVRKCEDFWAKHVLTKEPPDSAPSDSSLAKRLPIHDGLIMPIPDDDAGRWLALKRMESLVSKARKDAEARVLAWMNGSQFGATAWGQIELKKVKVNGYTVEDRVDIRMTTPRKASVEAFEALVGTQQLPALIGGVEADDE